MELRATEYVVCGIGRAAVRRISQNKKGVKATIHLPRKAEARDSTWICGPRLLRELIVFVNLLRGLHDHRDSAQLYFMPPR